MGPRTLCDRVDVFYDGPMRNAQDTVRGVQAAADKTLPTESRPDSVVHDDLDCFIGHAPPASDEEVAAMEWLNALPHAA